MPTVRVHGGLLASQNLTGSLRFFKVIGGADMFEYTVGTGDGGDPEEPVVIIPGIEPEFFVAIGAPVPGSAAERIVKLLIEKATLVQFAVVDDTELHLAFENTGFGWGADDPDDPAAAAAEMEAAIQASGPTLDGIHGVGDPGSNDPPVPDETATGGTVDLSGVTVEEVPFELA
jgi:hypothetical protein